MRTLVSDIIKPFNAVTEKTYLTSIFGVFILVNILIGVIWVVTSCNIIGGYRPFEETRCLHLQCRRRQQVSV